MNERNTPKGQNIISYHYTHADNDKTEKKVFPNDPAGPKSIGVFIFPSEKEARPPQEVPERGGLERTQACQEA
jgi:hypothetical protein